jgi:deoxyhypusine synthase
MVPLITNGWVDWIVSTGANLYHDVHFAMGLGMYRGSPFIDDLELKDRGVVRIYDVLFESKVLVQTDAYLTKLCRRLQFDGPIGSARLHHEIGLQLLKDFPDRAGLSVLATAAKYEVPVYASSPGDSTIGMTLSSLVSEGRRIVIDPSVDVNETSALVYMAHKEYDCSAVLLIGGGSPKNFALQTEPYLNELSSLDTRGHDYFLQFTDARPDTGGLSGATPSEAVSWGKLKGERLRDNVVCYGDATILLPMLVSYARGRAAPRKHTRAYNLRAEAVRKLFKDMKLPY